MNRESRARYAVREPGPARKDSSRLMAGHGSGSAVLYFLGRQVFLACRDGPNVSEGIRECTGAVAVELILHWYGHLTAGGDGLVKQGVHILNVQKNAHR